MEQTKSFLHLLITHPVQLCTFTLAVGVLSLGVQSEHSDPAFSLDMVSCLGVHDTALFLL